MPRPRPRPRDPAARFAEDAALPTASKDTLERIRLKAVELVFAEGVVAQLETDLELAKARRVEIAHRELPSLFEEAGVDRLGVDLPSGTFDVVSQPYYHAVLSADRMTPEALGRAFDHLEELGGGDLVRTQVQIPFQKEQLDQARKLLAQVQRTYPTASLKRDVPWTTLTAFLREWFERPPPAPGSNQPTIVPNLELLSATVGKVAKVKPRKVR